MSLFNENIPENLQHLPIEFGQFLQLCRGIDIDFSNCDIKVDEGVKFLEQYNETYVDVVIEEKNSNDEKTIIFSYVKDIDYTELVEQIDDLRGILTKSKEQYIEDFILDISVSDSYYKEIVSKYVDKHKCARTYENITKALSEEAETLYNDLVRNYQSVTAQYNQLQKSNEKLRFEACVHTQNMDIAYFQNMLKGSIFIPTGGMIWFEAIIDENGTINTINMYKYNSIADVAWVSDNKDSIDYKKISFELLASNGIEPTKREIIDFNALLQERHLEQLCQNPVGAVYILKDILLSKILTDVDTKKSVK